MIMESFPQNNLFMWVEFLLDKKKLKQHLSQDGADHNAITTLLAQFIINADRAVHLSGGGGNNGNGTTNSGNNSSSGVDSNEDDSNQAMTAEQLAAACRARKTRSLILMAMQVTAFLGWDLDALGGIPIVLQNSLMKHMLSLVNIGNDKANKPLERSREFLRVLYHRWVLRTLNNHNAVSRAGRANNTIVQGAEHFNTALNIEAVIKQLNEEESATYLKNFFGSQSVFAKVKDFKVPNVHTFENEKDPDWSVGSTIARTTFESLVHFEFSVYWLYKGNITEASQHFKNQKSRPEQYTPYLKISQEKMNGYKKALGLEKFSKSLDTYKSTTLDYSHVADIAKLMKKRQIGKLKRVLEVADDSDAPVKMLEKLNAGEIENYEGSLLASGDERLAASVYEAKLIETSDISVLKECLSSISRLPRIAASSNVLFYSKLFSGWELPIPVHHAVLNIPGGPFMDYIYVLVAKSRQLLTIRMFNEAREMLVAASLELGAKLNKSLRGGSMGPLFYNISKLMKMLEWEILLVDINQLFTEYNSSMRNASTDLIGRCKDCLEYLRDQNHEVNPRSEIVENILMALINIGEYDLVVHYDQTQNQRYPFLDFLALLARVCRDMFIERKDTSSSYRELWSAVLPLFSSYNTQTGTVMVGPALSGNPKKLGPSSLTSNKPILSNRHLLTWAIDRSCSQNLISVWASLLSRLHNHILDDVGLQIITEYLHIWPNILDDVTATSSVTGISDNKVSRVAGSSKLNSLHIRDYLFHLLGKALFCTSGNDMISWLRCLGDVHLAAGVPATAMKCYTEYLAMGTDFFEKHNSASFWGDAALFKRMIKCCELMGSHVQAVVLCQFLTEVDYSMAFGKAQEKITTDASDALYTFIWDLTILEFLINLHSKRNETSKRQEAIKIMGLLELNSNNNEEIQREAIYLRKSQFMRTLAKQYVFL